MFYRTDQENIGYLCTVDGHKGHNTLTVASLAKQKDLEDTKEKIQQMTVSNVSVQ